LGEPSVELNDSNVESDAASMVDDDADDAVQDDDPEIINEASIVYNALANTVLQSDIARSRSTADAFVYASGDSPWVPFNDSDDPIAIESVHYLTEWCKISIVTLRLPLLQVASIISEMHGTMK
jgi:hypothetical protein